MWSPYIRGERVPLHDPDRRGVLDGLNLTHDGASVRRAAFEASGFVVRQIIEMSGARATRIVATGGGTRVAPWMQAIADATGLPVSVSGVAEGAALGAAFLGKDGGGLESSVSRCRAVGVGRPDRRARCGVGGSCPGPLRQVPRAGRWDAGMTSSIFEGASMVSTVLRVRDVDASVRWYREKLGLEPVHVGSDGPEHPIAVYSIAGAVVSLWQLPEGRARVILDNDTNTYVVVVTNAELEVVRRTLAERGVDVGEIRRSANNEFLWFHDLDDNRFELSRSIDSRENG